MSGLHLSQKYKDWQFIQGEEHKEQDDDLISRQAVNEIINDIRDCISVEGYCAILERLKKLPSVNLQEPKTGHWIKMFLTDTGDIDGQCSECGFIHKFIDGHTAQYDYCPSCGARMFESQESEG